MAMRKISVSDEFNTFKYVLSLDETTSIAKIKEILAKTLKCEPKNILLANGVTNLEDSQTLNDIITRFPPVDSDILNLKATSFFRLDYLDGIPAEVAQDYINGHEEDCLTPALLLWNNLMRQRSANLPLQEIQSFGRGRDPLGREIRIDPDLALVVEPGAALPMPFDLDFTEPMGLEKSSSTGIPTAISMHDFERFVCDALRYPSAATGRFKFAELRKAWGLINRNILSFDDFQRLMELYSLPESHGIFMAAAKAAFYAAKQPFTGGLNDNKVARFQHVAQALLPLASDIFADAVNSSIYGGTQGVMAGFLPRREIEQCLRADGRIGAFAIHLSDTEACGVTLSYLAPPLSPSLPDEMVSREPRIINETLKLNTLASGYTLGGIDYPSLATALASNKLSLRYPCIIASLSTRLGVIKSAEILAPQQKEPSWVQFDTLMRAGIGAIDRTNFNSIFMGRIRLASKQVYLARIDANKTLHISMLPSDAMMRIPGGPASLVRYKFAGFHGAIGYDKTLEQLKNQPIGSHLLRASLNQRGSVILAFVDGNRKIQQSIISPDSTDPMSRQVINSGNYLPSLFAFLKAYSIAAEPGSSPLLIKIKENYPPDNLVAEATPWQELSLNLASSVEAPAVSVQTDTEDPTEPNAAPAQTTETNALLITPPPPASSSVYSQPDYFSRLSNFIWKSIFEERSCPSSMAIIGRPISRADTGSIAYGAAATLFENSGPLLSPTRMGLQRLGGLTGVDHLFAAAPSASADMGFRDSRVPAASSETHLAAGANPLNLHSGLTRFVGDLTMSEVPATAPQMGHGAAGGAASGAHDVSSIFSSPELSLFSSHRLPSSATPAFLAPLQHPHGLAATAIPTLDSAQLTISGLPAPASTDSLSDVEESHDPSKRRRV